MKSDEKFFSIIMLVFFFSVMYVLVSNLHAHFYLVYCIFAVVIVYHSLCSLMAFDCKEIKGLLTLLTYDTSNLVTLMLPSVSLLCCYLSVVV